MNATKTAKTTKHLSPWHRALALRATRLARQRYAETTSQLFRATAAYDRERSRPLQRTGPYRVAYSIILTMDGPYGDGGWAFGEATDLRTLIADLRKNGGRKWRVTEAGESEYDIGDDKGRPWRHRKYVAILTAAELKGLSDDMGLYASETETMGSLGAPGFGWGWSPAISFEVDSPYVSLSAYVTPVVLEGKGKRERFVEVDWDKLAKATRAKFAG